MKKLTIAIYISLFLTVLSSFNSSTPASGDKEKKFAITFNQNTGFTELGLIQAECDKKGIRLTYKKIEFDEAGLLKALAFNVDCQDGFSGSASTSHLNNKSGFGFYRDYTENSKSPFAVGNISIE